MLTEKEHKRIFSRIRINLVSKCWEYKVSLSDGYGRIYFRGKRYKAHRFFYENLVGSIPRWNKKGDLEIDHLCRNRCCVNPEHLELVTPKTNTLRGNAQSAINHRKTSCVHGHKSLYKVGNRRRCRECRRIFDTSQKRRAWREKRRAAKHQTPVL